MRFSIVENTPLHWQYPLTCIPGPDIYIEIDGDVFTGNDPDNVKLGLSLNTHIQLSGRYSNAAEYAASAAFDTPDGGDLKQGTSYNTSEDAYCNHQGNTTDGMVEFYESGNHTVIYKVNISGTSHEASVTVLVEGNILYLTISSIQKLFKLFKSSPIQSY